MKSAIEQNDPRIQSQIKAAEDAYENDQMEEALRLLRSLADQGVPEAHQFLAFLYKEGDGVPKDLNRSNEFYRSYHLLAHSLAISGHPYWQYKLACMKEYGDGVLPNPKEAVTWYEKAANVGNAEAQFHLSVLYEHGRYGLKRNNERSVEWLLKAVDNKHPESLYKLSLRLMADHEYDREEVEKLLKESADLGFWLARDILDDLDSAK